MSTTSVNEAAKSGRTDFREAYLPAVLSGAFSGMVFSGPAKLYYGEGTVHAAGETMFGVAAVVVGTYVVREALREKRKSVALTFAGAALFGLLLSGSEISRGGMFSVSEGFAPRMDYIEAKRIRMDNKAHATRTPMEGVCEDAYIDKTSVNKTGIQWTVVTPRGCTIR